MSWISDLKTNLQQAEHEKKQFDIDSHNEYERLSPLVMNLLRAIGKEWYGKLLFINKYKIDTLPGVFFWGIKRRGKGLESLPQRLHIKLRVLENRTYFAIDAAFTDGPTITVNTIDTSEENLKKAIVELVSQG